MKNNFVKIVEDIQIPLMEFEGSEQITCPYCGFRSCHFYKQIKVEGNDNYEAWEGRGDLHLTVFKGECGSIFAIGYGEHKGEVITAMLKLRKC